MAPFARPFRDLAPPVSARRPTINDVASLAGVSKKTVSRVINDEPKVRPETRARVEAVIDRTGYVPDPQARGLACGRSCLVGWIYEPRLASSLMQMPAGMLAALAGTGYELIVHQCNLGNPSALSDLRGFLRRQRTHGLILTPPISEDRRVLDLLDQMGCAYVRITAASGSDQVVDTHDRQGGRIAGDHLIDLGHRHMAVVTAPITASAAARAAGFRAALADRGIRLEADRVIAAAVGFEGGREAAAKLLGLDPPPTAVFADSDELAAGLLRAMADAGVTLAVVGYGDRALAQMVSPSLTTIRPMTWTVGAMAVRRLTGAPDTLGESSLPVLVARASTAAQV